MATTRYEVKLTPHYYYMGLPGEPAITVEIYKHTTKFLSLNTERVFDSFDRDLFKCVSMCNDYFKRENINPDYVIWPKFCKYIQGYTE